MPYFDILGVEINKKLSYLKWALSNLTNWKILQKNKTKRKKTKIPQFWTKSSLFYNFSVRLIKKLIFWFWNQHLLIFEISTINHQKILETFRNKDVEICLISNFCQDTKTSQFGTKNALFGYLWARFFLKMLYLKSALWNLRNCKVLQKNKNA